MKAELTEWTCHAARLFSQLSYEFAGNPFTRYQSSSKAIFIIPHRFLFVKSFFKKILFL